MILSYWAGKPEAPGWTTLELGTKPIKIPPHRRLILVGFSAGCQAVRAHLLAGVRPDAVVCLDGIHDSIKPAPERLAMWRELAARARRGECSFIMTHTRNTYVERLAEPYASTLTMARLISGLPLDEPNAFYRDGSFVVHSYPSAPADKDAHAAHAAPAFVRARLEEALALIPEPKPGPVVPVAHEVPKVATPLSEVGLALALRDGHIEAFGSPPSVNRLAAAWAQNALEHARGRATFNNNIGNVSAFGKWAGGYYVINVAERVKRDPDVWKKIDMRFRAHPSPVAGAADYWRILSGRYRAALDLFDSGDVYQAAWKLSELGYYTAHAEHYSEGMRGLCAHALDRVLPELARTPSFVTDPTRAGQLLAISDAVMAGRVGLPDLESWESIAWADHAGERDDEA